MPGELQAGEVQYVSVPVVEIPVTLTKNTARILSILVALIPLQICRARQEEKILEPSAWGPTFARRWAALGGCSLFPMTTFEKNGTKRKRQAKTQRTVREVEDPIL